MAGAEKQYTVRVIGDASSVKRSFRDAETASDRFARKMKRIGTGMASVGDKMTRGLTLPIVAGAALSVKAASDLDEAINKSNVVFGKAAKSVRAFADTAADSIGQSTEQAVSAAATFGNLFKTMGMGEAQTAKMSVQMVKLASDLASFHNIPIDVALEKLQAGLVGEIEPMRQLGVLINETAVKQEAYRMGLARTGDELTEQQKVQARYSLILQQTSDAQGDFARNSDSLANQVKTLKAQFTDVAAELGTALIPVAKQLAGALSRVAQWFGNLSPGMQSFIVKAGLMVAAIGPALSILGRLVVVVGSLTKAFAAIRAVAAAQSVTAFGTAAAGAATGTAALTAAVASLTIALGVVITTAAAAAAALAWLLKIKGDLEKDEGATGSGFGANIYSKEFQAIKYVLPQATAEFNKFSASVRSGGVKIADAKGKLVSFKKQFQTMRKLALEMDNKKAVKAIDKVLAELKVLNRTKARPSVTLVDNATSMAQYIRQRLQQIFASHITQTVDVSGGSRGMHHAAGGVFTTPHWGQVAESGAEAIVPLTRPKRAAEVMAQAGILGAGGGSAPVTVNINAPVYGVDDLYGIIASAVGAGVGAVSGTSTRQIVNGLAGQMRRGR